MGLKLNFDATAIKPSEQFEPVPDDLYLCRIVDSEPKPTKDNKGGYIQLILEIIEGKFAGCKRIDRLNLWNDNAQAVEIAQRQLSSYCHATGVLRLEDSTQLHGIPIRVHFGIRTQEGYEPSNFVRAVKAAGVSAPAQAPTAPAGFPTLLAPQAVSPAMPAQPPAPAWSQGGPVAAQGFTPTSAPAVPAMTPFGQNPALPPQQAPQQPWQQPALQTSAFATPAQQQAPTGAARPPWAK